VTGIHSLQSDLEVKRVELIKEALPRPTHLAVFWDPTFPRALDDISRPAQALNISIPESVLQRADEVVR
jgi:hypothetical protein